MGGKREWSYTTGRKGVNRVSVYERPDGAQIYIAWRDDDGRHDMSIEGMTGYKVTDRELAKDIADELSREQAKKRNAIARRGLFGFSPERTLGELLERMHQARGRKWSKSYTRDQKRFRRFWEERLGKDVKLAEVTAAEVEAVAGRVAAERDWSDRTHQSYLRYIVDAFYYAQKKLKWLDERHNLSAVDMPSPDPESKAYSEAELDRLLPALRDVDLRAGGVGEIAYATGRRLNAIRLLRADAIDLAGEVPLVRFPKPTDKARARGEAVLTPQAVGVVKELLETPAVDATGLLFPAGDLSDDGPKRDPIRKEELIDMLHAAEKRADPKVPHVKGRAYHGIKRRVASIAKDRRAMAKQSGTTEQTLRKVYEQDDLEPKKRLADLLASRREAE